MAAVKIEIDSVGNAAFEGDDMGREIGRILNDLAHKISQTSRAELQGEVLVVPLKDINGNRVGRAVFEVGNE